MGRPAGLREEHLCLAWERQWLDPRRLTTQGGLPLQVVYPGRRCGDPGPDFRDAVLALPDASLRHGDVEVHLATAGWEAHGHDKNPAYERVILHLTWEGGEHVTTSAGRVVPALALAACLAITAEQLAALPVRGRLPPGPSCPAALAAEQLAALGPFLEAQGVARLEARAAVMAADAAALGADEALWRALLRGLGYRRNSEPFLHLAQAVPWRVAALLARRSAADALALLLGAAGFLDPPPRPLPAEDEALRRIWATRWQGLRPWCAEAPPARQAWTVAGVRPENAPARRVAAAAAIAVAQAAGLSAALCAAVRCPDGPVVLAGEGDAYWRGHADLGRRVGPRPLALLGASRERELLTNAVLPAALAVALESGDSELEHAARRRYAGLAATGGNQLTRHMLRTIGAPQRAARTAAAEQGLLHLYHGWCRERRCWDCPLYLSAGCP